MGVDLRGVLQLRLDLLRELLAQLDSDEAESRQRERRWVHYCGRLKVT